jgi:hypothetical protein
MTMAMAVVTAQTQTSLPHERFFPAWIYFLFSRILPQVKCLYLYVCFLVGIGVACVLRC